MTASKKAKELNMKLTDYIQKHHNGNISEFARSQGVMPFQARRWLDRDCEWLNGGVWCKVSKHKLVN